ncbi:hypothetical protein BX666DRAFT_1985181 [Dichotomocladium elegans]|nr:hypothetical protein BX666DRAFT_1985181 [Dichotomocladium elegans]
MAVSFRFGLTTMAAICCVSIIGKILTEQRDLTQSQTDSIIRNSFCAFGYSSIQYVMTTTRWMARASGNLPEIR